MMTTMMKGFSHLSKRALTHQLPRKTMSTAAATTAKVGSLFGYETSKFRKFEIDHNQLEQCISSQVKSVVTRSCDEITHHYNLMWDMELLSQEPEGTPALVGHIFTPTMAENFDHSAQLEAFKKELELIEGCDYLTFLALPLDIFLHMQESKLTLRDFGLVGETTPALGVDFPQRLIKDMSLQELETLLRQLMPLIRDKARYISVSTNPFTLDQALMIKHFAKANGLTVLATDTMRVHERRPGSYYSQLKSLKESTNQELDDAIDNNLKLLSRACDASLKMELSFLEKYPNAPGVDCNKLFWAHKFNDLSEQILFPDEWNLTLNKMIAPMYNEAQSAVKKLNPEAREWAQLHYSFTKTMFAHFEEFLEIKSARLSKEVIDHLIRHSPHAKWFQRTTSDGKIFFLPETVAQMTAALGFDHVFVSGAEVQNDVWVNRSKIDFSDVDHDFRLVRRILNTYSGNNGR